MVSTMELRGEQRYYTGSYNETGAHGAQDLAACLATCAAAETGLPTTWAPGTQGEDVQA